jgi:hypothetical protein
MQNYVKNLAIQLNNSKNNKSTAFSQASNALHYVELLGKKTYQENNELIYFTALFFGVISQFATAVSSYSFFAEILAIKLSPTLLPFAVVLLLLLIEILKYVSIHKGLEGFFALPQRTNKALLVLAVLLSAISMYASILGGGNFGIDSQKITNTETAFNTEIASLQADIQAITNRNTWKGQTYLSKKEKNLVYAKENEITKLKAAKENKLQIVFEENKTAATQYQFGFAFFDALFLLCACYVWYFRQQVAIENMLVELQSASTIQQPIIVANPVVENTNTHEHHTQQANTQQHAIPKPSTHYNTNPIGFQYDFTHLKNTNIVENDTILASNTKNPTHEYRENLDTMVVDKEETLHDNHNLPNEYRENSTNPIIIETAKEGFRNCLHCKELYAYNAKKHRYCSDSCRWAAYRVRKQGV